MHVGYGRSTRVWDDIWMSDSSLRDSVVSIDVRDLDDVVADLITGDRMWSLDNLFTSLHLAVEDRILSTPVVQQ